MVSRAFLSIAISVIFILLTNPYAGNGSQQMITDRTALSNGQPSCSVLTCTIDNNVLFGNNQDGIRGTPYIAFGRTVDWNSGGLWVFDEPVCYSGYMTAEGKPTSTEASMNQDGLCVASNGLPPIPMTIDPEKENYTCGSGSGGPIHDCCTVEDVIEFYNQHNYMPDGNNPIWGVQLHYADASGDAVVVGGDENGDVVYTAMNDSNFLVSTNHNLAVPDNYYSGHYRESHERFDTATDMLQDVVANSNLTVDSIRDILDAIHAERSYDPLMETSHSFIFNPVTLDIYAYYRHDYSKVFSFNLLDEIETLGNLETRIYNLTELYENWESTLTSVDISQVFPIAGIAVLVIVIIAVYGVRYRE